MNRPLKIETIPDIPEDLEEPVRSILKAMKNVVDVREGRLGPVAPFNVRSNRFVTLMDLLNAGFQIINSELALPPFVAATPTWVKVGDQLPYTDFQDAATSKSNTLFSLEAGSVISGTKVKHSTAFAGTGIATVTMEVGIVGTTDKYATAFNVLQAVAGGAFRLSDVMGSESHIADTSILITARSTGANLSALTSGVVDVWALISNAE